MFLGGFGGLVGLLFVMVLSFNLCGLLPYVFSNTRHLVVTFVLALIL